MSSHQQAERLLLLLDELQKRLSSPDGSTESNPSQMFAYFLERSSAGAECAYARKALLLFMKRDWEDVRNILCDIVKVIEEGEGIAAAGSSPKED